jgi:hypothetical protein
MLGEDWTEAYIDFNLGSKTTTGDGHKKHRGSSCHAQK